MRRLIGVALRITLSGVLLALVISAVDLGQVVRELRSARPSYVAATLTLALVGVGVNSFKWQGLLAAVGCSTRWRDVLTANIIAVFYNLALPGLVGGEIARGWRMARVTRRPVETTVSLVTDRTLGLTALLLIGIVALWLAPPFPGRGTFRLAALLLLLGMVAFAVVSLARRTRRFARSIAARLTVGIRLGSVGRFIERVSEALEAYRDAPGALVQALGLGLVVQTLMVIMNYLICRAVNIDISVVNIVWVAAVVALAVSLPISIAGLGVRESAYVALLGQCGVPGAQALSVSFIMLSVYVLTALIGGLIQLTGLGSGPSDSTVTPAQPEETEPGDVNQGA